MFVIPICLITLEIFLNIVVVGTAVNAFLILLIVTSPIWLVLLVCWWPIMLGILFMLKFSSLRTYATNLVTSCMHYLLYTYKGDFRKQMWSFLYSLLSFGISNNIVAQNCGFALVSATGESLHDLKRPLQAQEIENMFQLQLYHRCVQTFGNIDNCRVLDLACGRGGGLAFL